MFSRDSGDVGSGRNAEEVKVSLVVGGRRLKCCFAIDNEQVDVNASGTRRTAFA